MQRGNAATAYDFEMFANKSQSSRPDLSVIKSEKYHKRDRMTVVKVISTVIVMVAVICVMLYSRAQLTELTNQIGKFNKEYNTLRSEYSRISAELEGKVSLRGVEESAKAIGLNKVQSYQVEYVNIDTPDSFSDSGAAAPERTFSEKISLYIGSVLEYIKAG